MGRPAFSEEHASAIHADQLENLLDYGFTHGETKQIILGRPTVLSISDENILGKLQNLEAPRFTTHNNTFALTREEVIQFVLSFPRVLGLDCERNGNMDRKLRLMALITDGDKQAMLENAQRFIQGPAKTLARIKHLKSSGVNWKTPGALFVSEATFRRRYH
ncbi:MAG: hypothetical protein ABH842_04435 [Candidatus Micrarchaeota archaeon]